MMLVAYLLECRNVEGNPYGECRFPKVNSGLCFPSGMLFLHLFGWIIFFFPSSFPPLASSYEARRITYFSGIPERKNLFILLVTKSDLINVRDVTLSLFTFL